MDTKCILLTFFFFYTSFAFNSDRIVNYVNSLNTTWVAGDNFLNVRLNSMEKFLSLKRRQGSEIGFKSVFKNGTIPSKFDARNNWPKCGYIGHIRNQGACAAGWAIAAATTFSDRYCIASNGTFSKPFSFNELVACCGNCGDGCNGGLADEAWKFFQNIGVVTGGDYHSHSGCQPYQVSPCDFSENGKHPKCSKSPKAASPECIGECINRSYPLKFEKDHRKVKQVYQLKNDPEQIQIEIMTNGPVQAGFIVYEDFLTYKSGIYKQTTGNTIGGHSVRIIGWGEEESPYWIVANSWDKNWGENGFFKIRRGTNECGIEDQIIAGEPIILNENY